MADKSFKKYLEEKESLDGITNSTQDTKQMEKNFGKLLNANGVKSQSVKATESNKLVHIEITLNDQKDFDKTVKILKGAEIKSKKIGSGFALSIDININ